MTLPAMDGDLLPSCPDLSPYRCTFDEVRARFVEQAPYPDERDLVMRTLEIYAGRVWNVLPGARLWVDGGFVTHKKWAAPKDADVVIVITAGEAERLDEAGAEALASLLTLQGMTAQVPSLSQGRVQPMGG